MWTILNDRHKTELHVFLLWNTCEHIFKCKNVFVLLNKFASKLPIISSLLTTNTYSKLSNSITENNIVTATWCDQGVAGDIK